MYDLLLQRLINKDYHYYQYFCCTLMNLLRVVVLIDEFQSMNSDRMNLQNNYYQRNIHYSDRRSSILFLYQKCHVCHWYLMLPPSDQQYFRMNHCKILLNKSILIKHWFYIKIMISSNQFFFFSLKIME